MGGAHEGYRGEPKYRRHQTTSEWAFYHEAKAQAGELQQLVVVFDPSRLQLTDVCICGHELTAWMVDYHRFFDRPVMLEPIGYRLPLRFVNSSKCATEMGTMPAHIPPLLPQALD